jgi:hypothetical protein
LWTAPLLLAWPGCSSKRWSRVAHPWGLDADDAVKRRRGPDHGLCQRWWQGLSRRELRVFGYGSTDERHALAFHVGGSRQYSTRCITPIGDQPPAQ